MPNICTRNKCDLKGLPNRVTRFGRGLWIGCNIRFSRSIRQTASLLSGLTDGSGARRAGDSAFLAQHRPLHYTRSFTACNGDGFETSPRGHQSISEFSAIDRFLALAKQPQVQRASCCFARLASIADQLSPLVFVPRAFHSSRQTPLRGASQRTQDVECILLRSMAGTTSL